MEAFIKAMEVKEGKKSMLIDAESKQNQQRGKLNSTLDFETNNTSVWTFSDFFVHINPDISVNCLIRIR